MYTGVYAWINVEKTVDFLKTPIESHDFSTFSTGFSTGWSLVEKVGGYAFLVNISFFDSLLQTSHFFPIYQLADKQKTRQKLGLDKVKFY